MRYKNEGERKDAHLELYRRCIFQALTGKPMNELFDQHCNIRKEGALIEVEYSGETVNAMITLNDHYIEITKQWSNSAYYGIVMRYGGWENDSDKLGWAFKSHIPSFGKDDEIVDIVSDWVVKGYIHKAIEFADSLDPMFQRQIAQDRFMDIMRGREPKPQSKRD